MQQVINDSRRASPMVFMACCRNCWIFLISHSDPALPPCHHFLPLSLDEMLVWVLKNCVVAIELPGGRGLGEGAVIIQAGGRLFYGQIFLCSLVSSHFISVIDSVVMCHSLMQSLLCSYIPLVE